MSFNTQKRYSYAIHFLEADSDIRSVQELPDYKDIKTTMIYMRVLNRSPKAIHSSLDRVY